MAGRMLRRGLAVAVLALGLWAASAVAREPDRLDRFRAVAAEKGSAAAAELESLVDEEVLENLTSGGVFASAPVLQERLDGFADVWGGLSLHAIRAGSLLAVVFRVTDGFDGSSVRVYGRRGPASALLVRLAGPGRPSVHTFPPAARGAAQLLVAWDGAPTGRGTSALRLDLLREQGDGMVVAWTTTQALGEDVAARSWSVRGPEIRLRYELRYPGWAPGCDHQTEREDVYRAAPATGTLTRVHRQEHEGWHRAMHQDVEALLHALASGDRQALIRVVPDAVLRERLPRRLALDAACDAPDGPSPRSVSVAATQEDGGRPWTLVFRREGGRWRLREATPVLQ